MASRGPALQVIQCEIFWSNLRSDISISIFPPTFQEKTYNFVEIIGPMIQYRFKLQHVLSRAIKISKISTESIIVYLSYLYKMFLMLQKGLFLLIDTNVF